MISVCMATYNGEKYIKEQLNSILKQLSKTDEIIISDDGSKDGTKAVIDSIDDERIRFIENHGTHGFTHNFENALRHAKGDYIFLSDQDDIWMDNKVAIIMEELETYDFVTHDCITVDAQMQVISESRFKDFNVRPGFVNHLIKSRYLGCCMAFNRKVMDVVLPFPKNDFLVEHDIWIAAVAFLYFKAEVLRIPLIYYRRHGNNVSDGGFTKGYSAKVKLEKRGYRLLKLLKAYPRVHRANRC
nr:glycosyltransferase family 2 protein [uncultured Mediterraneibacter sp.]